jgi:hypothetical protein
MDKENGNRKSSTKGKVAIERGKNRKGKGNSNQGNNNRGKLKE